VTIICKVLPGGVVVKDSARGEVVAQFATVRPDVVDLDGDVYRDGAIRPADGVPVSSWNHGSSVLGGPLPVGSANIRVVGDQAVADIKYFLDSEDGRRAFDVVRRLGSTEWSWSLDVIDSEPVTLADGRTARQINRVRALEVSPVLQGAGIGTRTLTTRSAPDMAARELVRWARASHERRVRSGLIAIRDGVCR
jgi:GNAT superfamily N-acetyltransferase